MLLFFYGPNHFLITRKVRELKDKYLAKAGGDFNLSTIDGALMQNQDYLRQIQAVPLLSSSRLIIIEDVFKNKNKELHEIIKNSLNNIPPSTVLLFVEKGNPDKRLGLFKALSRSKESHEFKAIEPYNLSKFICRETTSRGAKIDNAASDLLAEFAGDNLWQISNEIDKLINFSGGLIEKKHVEEVVEKNVTSNIFAMIDDLTKDKKDKVLKHLEDLLLSGEPPLRILSLINYQFRSLALVKEAAESSPNQYAISKATKLSPFQVSKVSVLAKRFSYKRLAKIYAEIARVDFEIKTGRIEDSEGLRDLVLSI